MDLPLLCLRVLQLRLAMSQVVRLMGPLRRVLHRRRRLSLHLQWLSQLLDLGWRLLSLGLLCLLYLLGLPLRLSRLSVHYRFSLHVILHLRLHFLRLDLHLRFGVHLSLQVRVRSLTRCLHRRPLHRLSLRYLVLQRTRLHGLHRASLHALHRAPPQLILHWLRSLGMGVLNVQLLSVQLGLHLLLTLRSDSLILRLRLNGRLRWMAMRRVCMSRVSPLCILIGLSRRSLHRLSKLSLTDLLSPRTRFPLINLPLGLPLCGLPLTSLMGDLCAIRWRLVGLIDLPLVELSLSFAWLSLTSLIDLGVSSLHVAMLCLTGWRLSDCRLTG
jgi:hypothetical protein